MRKRYLSIWFRYLKTDWFSIRRPELKLFSFVLAVLEHGRMVIQAANPLAEAENLEAGMAVADARAVVPELQVIVDRPGLQEKLLQGIAEWCIRYTPDVAVDPPDGLLLDITGCPHLWGGEKPFITDVVTRLTQLGYHVHAAITDTVGSAWALARYGKEQMTIIAPGEQYAVLLDLPPKALRLEQTTIERLHKLGLKQIGQFIQMPRATLQKRFGPHFIMRLHQALGLVEEHVEHFQPAEIFQERLPCLSPVVTATGIEIALQQLLQNLCGRLQKQQKGIRKACLKGFRVDGKIETINIGTHRPSNNAQHLFKLFELHISGMEPALGIELFLLDAVQVEDLVPVQEGLWKPVDGLLNTQVAELLDRLSGKIGNHCIHRYLPDEHYLPELSYRKAVSIGEQPTAEWRLDRPRPLHLLKVPEPIEVTAPIPDYPPMLFRRKGQLHKVVSADGPERIEQAWWLQQGEHRDYYILENEQGQRYWVFRLGHYRGDQSQQWFIHGLFP